MATLKELSKKEVLISSGHRACAGCGFPVIIKQALLAAENPVVVSCATGCMEVCTTIYPYTAWKVPFIHNAFENSASTLSGVEAAYKSLSRQGKIDKKIDFIAFGGDGGTYDIGFQALSGAMERGHNMLYICYDNQAYMNTGIQRSSATPRGANTTTSPAGTESYGKKQYRKDLSAIMVAHEIPYVAQASPSNWNDLVSKVKKALAVEGPAFMNIIQPCVLGWKYPSDQSMELARLAVDTCFWPLYEVEDGEYRLTYKPKEKKPVEDWLKRQDRFRHLFKPENAEIVKEIQEDVDERWAKLLAKCGEEA
ncbi:MAG TPA: thiamine pyrophosphate-dependent enzyme [Bacillota bacterium]|nr:thiamine pyrophosphate-dependent enzyme [Bacillota bacterium]HOK70752.1 thiamine pyrophosphate-dependent enzyme [Bacillota bacterium]HOL50674.1 thiamine pyrophosphate-dependent enzyme [Bacillota bacterium]HOO30116.1 thiamine pyrophosphate-dependent enzyme [Bacillota bacterium]HPQ03045.1 thiamine pyrophosphate-dependent enzyme [Bacillota bacterium]